MAFMEALINVIHFIQIVVMLLLKNKNLPPEVDIVIVIAWFPKHKVLQTIEAIATWCTTV